MISATLAGKRIAVTGSTGFLGTALVERLLRCVPDAELILLVRPGRRGADDRVRREVLKNDCFDRLTDDELIACLRVCYDAYEGGLDAVCSLTIEELTRGRRLDDADDPDDEEEADE